MNELDVMLRDALRADAARAPSMPPEWSGPTTATIVPIATRRPGRRVAVAAAGIAAAVAAVGVLAAVGRPDDPEQVPASEPIPIPTPWQPAGTEFPIVDLDPATESPDGPVVAALTRAIGIDGHPDQVVTTSITYQGGATAIVQECTWEGGSGGCRPEWNPAPWSISVTSSVDNGDAAYDLWTVEGLPAEAAFVSYADGDQFLWQRPVAGFAAFPNVEGPNEVVIAYDHDGAEVGRYGGAEYLAVASSAVPPLTADISQDQFEALTELTRASMGACLTGQGGTVGEGGVATFAEGVDQLAIWNRCVAEVKQVVAQRVTEYAPRFFDGKNERPQNPDTPWGYDTAPG